MGICGGKATTVCVTAPDGEEGEKKKPAKAKAGKPNKAAELTEEELYWARAFMIARRFPCGAPLRAGGRRRRPPRARKRPLFSSANVAGGYGNAAAPRDEGLVAGDRGEGVDGTSCGGAGDELIAFLQKGKKGPAKKGPAKAKAGKAGKAGKTKGGKNLQKGDQEEEPGDQGDEGGDGSNGGNSGGGGNDGSDDDSGDATMADASKADEAKIDKELKRLYGAWLPTAWGGDKAPPRRKSKRTATALYTGAERANESVTWDVTSVWDPNNPLSLRQKLTLLLLSTGISIFGGSACWMANPSRDYDSDFDLYLGTTRLDPLEKNVRDLLKRAKLDDPSYKYGKRGESPRLRCLTMKVDGASFDIDVTYQPEFKREPQYVHDADCLVATLVGNQFVWKWNPSVTNNDIRVDSLGNVIDRTQKMITWMLVNDEEMAANKDLSMKCHQRSVKKQAQNWNLIFKYLKGYDEKKMKSFVDRHAGIEKMTSAPGFRGRKSAAVEAALIATLAGELERRKSSVRIARAPDGDPVYDFVIVDAKDAAKAILEGWVPNLLWDGRVLGGQAKTSRGVKHDASFTQTSKALLLKYKDAVFVKYDYATGRFLIVRDGKVLADLVKEGRRVDLPACQRRHKKDDHSDVSRAYQVYLDPRHPDGAELWEAHGCATMDEAVAKLEGIFKTSKKKKKTYDQLFSTMEYKELASLATFLGDDGELRLSSVPFQLVDAYLLIVIDGHHIKLKLQAKGTETKTRNRYIFAMHQAGYDKDSFHLFLCTIREGDEIRGHFLLPRQVLWRHRHFPGQKKRRSQENLATKEPVVNTNMLDVIVASIEGGLDVPGLEKAKPSRIHEESGLEAFMKDAQDYYIPADADPAAARSRILKIVQESSRDLNEDDEVPLDDVADTPEARFKAGICRAGYRYVLGKKGGTRIQEVNGGHKYEPTYEGRETFGLDGWTVAVALKYQHRSKRPGEARPEHLEFEYFPPPSYFFKKDATYSTVTSGAYYATTPKPALDLKKAFDDGGTEAAMNEMIRWKSETNVEVIKILSSVKHYKGKPRPKVLADAQAEVAKKKAEKEAEKEAKKATHAAKPKRGREERDPAELSRLLGQTVQGDMPSRKQANKKHRGEAKYRRRKQKREEAEEEEEEEES